MTLARSMVIALAGALVIGGCGGRSPYWDQPAPSAAASYGLQNGVALVDNADHRVVFITAQPDQNIARQSLPIGHNVLNVSTSSDGKRLFVLSEGDWPRQTVNDEFPSLTVLDASTFTMTSKTYRMSVPLANLALDPLGDADHAWAVAYAGPMSTTSFVQNPNEIVLFDLTKPPSYAPAPPNPVLRTIQSVGGTPQQLLFTPTLMLPKGPRRLLLIETTVDLTMLDLNHAFDQPTPPPEITVQLTSGANADQVTPAGIAMDGRDPNDPNDARLALWAANNTNVFSILFGAAPPNTASGTGPANDFAPSINLTDVGGVPSALAFVKTGSGGAAAGTKPLLRVAALVPSRSNAVLLDPDTSVTTPISLPAAYSSFTLVTDVAATKTTTPTDVALLWNAGAGAASGIALWTLGDSVGQPYRSVDVLGATQPIVTAEKVPNTPPGTDLEVLEMANGAGFYVLDLVRRRAPPLVTMQRATLAIAPDGGRMWAFAPGGVDLSSIDFTTLNPIPLRTALPIAAVYDVARASGPTGGRSLIAIHAQGTVGATVFDAISPDTATSRRVPSLLLEGP
jgi:hypothetical protein